MKEKYCKSVSIFLHLHWKKNVVLSRKRGKANDNLDRLKFEVAEI